MIAFANRKNHDANLTEVVGLLIRRGSTGNIYSLIYRFGSMGVSGFINLPFSVARGSYVHFTKN